MSFLWDKEKMIFKNELKNKKNTINIKQEGGKIKLFDQKIPADVLFYLLQGLTWTSIKNKGFAFNRKDQSFKFNHLNSRFIMFLGERGEIKKLLVKEKEGRKITIIEVNSHFWYDKKTGKPLRLPDQKESLSGSGSMGSLYKKIRIYNNYSEDFFSVEVTKWAISDSR